MEKWSSLLAQDKLSDSTQREATAHLSQVIDADALRGLFEPCENKSDVKKKKRSFGSLKNHLPDDLVELIFDELDEIHDDIGWKKSPRGRYVTQLNDWLQPIHREIKSAAKFSDLLVGGHSKYEVLYVAGTARCQGDLDELLEILQSHNPPWKIMMNVTITSDVG